VIVANPPYVAESELTTLQAEVQKEPRLALLGGPDGLSVVRRIIENAPMFLASSGWLLIEVDPRQAPSLISDVGRTAFDADGQVENDLSGDARVVTWQKGAP
jgi:release factor glutamine methyltransferase